VSISSLEEVFLKTGGDRDIPESADFGGEIKQSDDEAMNFGDDFDRGVTLRKQVNGLWRRRMALARNDIFRAVAFTSFPLIVGLIGFLLNVFGVLGTPGDLQSNIVMSLIVAAGYLPVVSLVSDGIVFERTSKLRNILTIIGLEPRSYWIGTFLGEYTLLVIPGVLLYIIALICAYVPPPVEESRDDYLTSMVEGGKLLWLLLLSTAQLICFCAMLSFFFSSPRLAIATMPFFSIVLAFLPVILVAMFWYGFGPLGEYLIWLSG
jgi:hypothetical protein